MYFDHRKLRGRIREKYGTEQRFAAAMGMARTSLSAKLNNVGDFTRAQIHKAAQLLELDAAQIPEHFFTLVDQKHDHPA